MCRTLWSCSHIGHIWIAFPYCSFFDRWIRHAKLIKTRQESVMLECTMVNTRSKSVFIVSFFFKTKRYPIHLIVQDFACARGAKVLQSPCLNSLHFCIYLLYSSYQSAKIGYIKFVSHLIIAWRGLFKSYFAARIGKFH